MGLPVVEGWMKLAQGLHPGLVNVAPTGACCRHLRSHFMNFTNFMNFMSFMNFTNFTNSE